MCTNSSALDTVRSLQAATNHVTTAQMPAYASSDQRRRTATRTTLFRRRTAASDATARADACHNNKRDRNKAAGRMQAAGGAEDNKGAHSLKLFLAIERSSTPRTNSLQAHKHIVREETHGQISNQLAAQDQRIDACRSTHPMSMTSSAFLPMARNRLFSAAGLSCSSSNSSSRVKTNEHRKHRRSEQQTAASGFARIRRNWKSCLEVRSELVNEPLEIVARDRLLNVQSESTQGSNESRMARKKKRVAGTSVRFRSSRMNADTKPAHRRRLSASTLAHTTTDQQARATHRRPTRAREEQALLLQLGAHEGERVLERSDNHRQNEEQAQDAQENPVRNQPVVRLTARSKSARREWRNSCSCEWRGSPGVVPERWVQHRWIVFACTRTHTEAASTQLRQRS